MRIRLAIVFLLIVLVPLGLLVGLGLKMLASEQELVRHQFEKLQRDRLVEVESLLRATLEEIERELLRATSVSAEPERLRELERSNSLLRQTFAVADNGRLIHPAPETPLSQNERDFLQRTQQIWEGQAVLYRTGRSETSTIAARPARRTRGGDNVLDLARAASHGWITWYWEEGVHFLFWRRGEPGGVIGGEVERISLLARLVGKLPALETERGRVVLVDARGESVHQWGALDEATSDTAPLVTRELNAPLDFMRLEYYPAPEAVRAFSGEATRFNTFAAMAAVGLVLLGLAFYFYREYTRDMREAARRVSFVTQVSHELKTPLTNIRLYAELLMENTEDDEDEGPARRQLGVIVSESQRLTRLINNILTFAKQRRGTLKLECAPIVVDEVITSVLGQFTPALESKKIAAVFSPSAPSPVHADRDAIGQIISNLVSNVEKYAAAGGELKIESRQDQGVTKVTVSDNGPGIPDQHRERIFDPFYRVSDRLSDGVVGTGLGLTIARDLARMHGGDLVLTAEQRQGASFELTL